MNGSVPLRVPCPVGACTCAHEALLADPSGDLRILQLTREEEKRLVARIEAVRSLPELWHVCELIDRQLGVRVSIRPSPRGVRTARGIDIQLEPRPGLCRKTRQALPAAIRRCLAANDGIVYALLDAQGLPGLVDDQDSDSAGPKNS